MANAGATTGMRGTVLGSEFQTGYPARRSLRFILLVALANAGGVIGFLPLLTLLLPVKVAGIAGDDRIAVFTATVIAGALAASASNILFGWLSDRSVARGHGRRGWIMFGLAGLAASFAAVTLAVTPVQIILAVALFQTAVNAVLAPMFAVMADEVPDAQKGLAGGLIALGAPLASAVAALMVAIGISSESARLAFVLAAVLLCVLPLLLAPSRIAPAAAPPHEAPLLGRDLAIAWASRLLVQVAGNVLWLYLVYYFASIDPATPASKHVGALGQLMTVAYLVPLPIAVLAGRWSDRIGRRKPFLIAFAALAALGLTGLAFVRDWNLAALAFALYALGSAAFLSLHSGFAMQLLPDPRHRGRDLGLINLTNTLPALAGPALTWALATPHDFGPVMLALAGLTLLGGLLVLAIRHRR
ncbi:MFS transporter [Sphingomonas sp. BT-65]|uniref:MFS transporter n=1 Tax=Sphingomonas sp. BT-65 TaxID=2989821 RepID=UPI0022356C86|nr:MFS transporter [Sphingomonas sp. BT-65]MCW4463873.1 MFS transporter [Sphingomonas sp. BT-65]